MAGVVVEDMANGLNEWRNIQEVIRLTFKYLVDTVRTQEHTLRVQGEAITRLERLAEQKASRSEVQGLLAQKASAADLTAVNRRLSELNRFVWPRVVVRLDLEAATPLAVSRQRWLGFVLARNQSRLTCMGGWVCWGVLCFAVGAGLLHASVADF